MSADLWHELAPLMAGRTGEDIPPASADVILLAWPPVRDGLLREMGTLQGRRVLDFGCGCGHLARRLDQLGARVVGVDSCPAMIDAARNLALPHAEFRVGSVETLGPHERFAAVLAVMVMPFVENPGPLFQALSHALEPGGMLFVVSYNIGFVQLLLREDLLFHDFDSRTRPRHGILDLTGTNPIPVHVHYPEEYAYAAEEAGLRQTLEARPPFTPEFLARYPVPFPTQTPEFLVMGFRKSPP